MKKIVFISYSAKESEEEATWIKWYLEEILHWNVVRYNDSKSRATGSVPTALLKELKDSDLFIQVLKGSVGSPTDWTASKPILQWEFETFNSYHHKEYNRCLLLNCCSLLSPATGDNSTKEYLTSVFRFINPKTPKDIQEMLGDVIGFTNQQQSMYGELVGGFLDCKSIVQLMEIRNALRNNRRAPDYVVIDQKHLYASPYAAKLWIELTTHNISSPLKIVYDQYPFNNDKKLPDEVEKMVKSSGKTILRWVDGNNELGVADVVLNVIVLGGGNGVRELKTCNWIAKACGVASINALLVDISPELLAVAADLFKHSPVTKTNTSIAIIDIEQHPEAIREVRKRMMPPGHGLFIFLGPTLCNVAEASFLEELHNHGMESGDLIFCEVLLCDDSKPVEAKVEEESADNDPRFKFITNPLITLGIIPETARFSKITVDDGKDSINHIWRYEEKKGVYYNLAIVKAMRKAYCRKSFETAGFEVLDIVEHEYEIQEKKLKFGYVIAKAREKPINDSVD